MQVPAFEYGDTIQFTWVASLAPDSAPILKVAAHTPPSLGATVLSSITATSSTTTSYYAMYTAPSSAGIYYAEWFAQRSVSGSMRNFVKTLAFEVRAMTVP